MTAVTAATNTAANVAKKASKWTVGNVLTKGAALATLGMVAYDSHVVAKIESSQYQKDYKSKDLESAVYNTMRQDQPSVIQNSIKKSWFRFKADENFSEFVTGITGYTKSFGNMLVKNIVPLGLATGAICTKGVVSKTFGVGLLLHGALFMVHDVMGIGKAKY